MTSETDQIKASEQKLSTLLAQGSQLFNVNQYNQLSFEIEDYNQKARAIAYRQAILRKINTLAYEAAKHKSTGFILSLTDTEQFSWQRARIDPDSIATGNLGYKLSDYPETKSLKQLFNLDPDILGYLNRSGYQTQQTDNLHIKILIPSVETVSFDQN